MATSANIKRRKKVLVDRQFQLQFIWRLGGILFFYLLIFLMISVVAPVGFTMIGSSAESAIMETAFRFEVLLNLTLVPMICTFLCLFVHGILETFRIAGPNYRFQQVLRDVSSGKIPRGVRVREKDYLQDTAELMNGALVSMHDRIKEMRQHSREARQLMAEGSTDAAAAVERLDDMLQRFVLVTHAPACQPVEEAGATVSDASVGGASATPVVEALAEEPVSSDA